MKRGGYQPHPCLCARCREVFDRRADNQYRCPECQQQVNRKRRNARGRQRRAERLEEYRARDRARWPARQERRREWRRKQAGRPLPAGVCNLQSVICNPERGAR